MASLNKCCFIGNLGADPETRFTANGDAVCNIRIACTETWKDKSTGDRKEATEWVRISFFGPLAKIAGDYLRKGSQVYIEGSMHTRKYQDKDGKDTYTTEIKGREMKMLGSKSDGGSAPSQDDGYQAAPRQQPQQQRPAQQQAPAAGGFASMDDDIPFTYIGRGISGHSL